MNYRILIVFFIALSFRLNAETIQWEQCSQYVNIGKYISILEDKEGAFTIDEVGTAAFIDQFKPATKDNIHFGFTESIYWLRFSFNNNTNSNLLLEVEQAFLPITELYYADSDTTFVKLQAGYKIPLTKKIVKHHFQVFPLPNGNHEFYVRVLSNTHPLPIKIWDKDKYEIQAYKQQMIYGVYVGFMLFAIIVNLFLFFSLRKGLYLLYVLVVIGYLSYTAMVMEGYILYIAPKLDLMYWYSAIPSIGVVFQTIYGLVFLEVKKYLPKLNQAIWVLISYFALYAIVRHFLPLTIIFKFNTLNVLLAFFIMTYAGIHVGKKGNALGYYFALAYFIYFLLLMTEAIYIQTGTPPHLLGFSYASIGSLIEALFLSYLLAKKFEWEKLEIENAKLEAQQKLIDKTIENERIVKEQNALLEKEVAKRTQNLKGVNRELEEALKTKDKFMSIIAHDLKSPFNAMLGFSRLLLDKSNKFTQSKQYEYNEIINKELHSTYNLLDNLLLWSNAQHDCIAFTPENLNLYLIVLDTCELIEHQANKKNIKIINQVHENVFVWADRNMLLTIIRNLIANALKFTHKNGEIKIAAQQKIIQNKLFYEVEVKDNGIGIPEDSLKKLFIVDASVTTRGTDNEKGTGLGLLLCKDFAEKHDGEIWAESVVGVGSSFKFTIPEKN